MPYMIAVSLEMSDEPKVNYGIFAVTFSVRKPRPFSFYRLIFLLIIKLLN